MAIKTTRYLSCANVRAMCMAYGYCTRCDNKDYESLLIQSQAPITDNDILKLAGQIRRHSDVEGLTRRYNCTATELLENICFHLINDCAYTIVELTPYERERKMKIYIIKVTPEASACKVSQVGYTSFAEAKNFIESRIPAPIQRAPFTWRDEEYTEYEIVEVII